MNWKSSDTTGHDTGLGTGLSLARGSGDCFDFPAAFLFDGMTDIVKEIMILANCHPRGVTLIFSYIRRLWLFILFYFFFLGGGGGVQNFKFFIYFGVFRKINIFWVLNFCEYLGGGHDNIGLYLGAISMHFRVFFKVNVQNGEYFFSC